MTDIFYPKTALIPHHPQILHQMVLQLFLMADSYEGAFPTENLSRCLIMPYGAYFDTGVVQAAGYRYRMGTHKPKHVVLISFADMKSDADIVTCSYDKLHTFFGDLTVNHTFHELHTAADNTLFAAHADPIICQLPFLRSYQKIDDIVPLIINTKKTAGFDRNLFRSTIRDRSGETCYVVCTNEIDDTMAALSVGYESITSDYLLTLPLQKTSSHSL